jgi:ferritin-like metal-binding protein YciE
LPDLHRAVQSEGLAQVVEEHLEQTKEHASRLEQVFRAVGAEPSSNLSAPRMRSRRATISGVACSASAQRSKLRASSSMMENACTASRPRVSRDSDTMRERSSTL